MSTIVETAGSYATDGQPGATFTLEVPSGIPENLRVYLQSLSKRMDRCESDIAALPQLLSNQTGDISANVKGIVESALAQHLNVSRFQLPFARILLINGLCLSGIFCSPGEHRGRYRH